MLTHQSFGSYLRLLRFKAGYGLRTFAEAIEMQPSHYFKVERGRTTPPHDLTLLERIADTLGLSKRSEERVRLFDLAVTHIPRQPATHLRVSGVQVKHNTVQNILRIKGLVGSGSKEIYAALAGSGIIDGPKESPAAVNAMIQRVQSISRYPIIVSLRASSTKKMFPFTAEIQWRGELSEK